MMPCIRCSQDIDTSGQSFLDVQRGVVWCRPCLTIDLNEFATEAEKYEPADHDEDDDDEDDDDPRMETMRKRWEELEALGPLPAPPDDGTQTASCEPVTFRLPNGQEFSVSVDGQANALVVGHDLIDHPVQVIGRNADGDILIGPGKPLRDATLDYRPPTPLGTN